MRKVILSLSLLLWSLGLHATTVEMTVNGLVCGFCAQGIEKRLRRFKATADVLVSLEKRLVAVGLREGQDIPDADLTAALREAGYDVKGISRTDRTIPALRELVKEPE